MFQKISIFLVVITVTTIHAAPTQENEIPCICNKIYVPVCASDGKTYSNACMLECAKKKQPDLSFVKDGSCDQDKLEEEDTNIEQENYCVCTFEYNPVCGTDGRSYSNLCMLNCMQKENKDVKLAYEGECNEKVCICKEAGGPVCASTLVSYNNLCELECAQKFNAELRKIHDGKCTQLDNNCKCDKRYQPICATNNKTYDNLCIFECAKENQQALSINNEGICDSTEDEDSENTVADEQAICSCRMEFKPVCGTDDKTYSNLCILNCVKQTNKDITLAYAGKCEKRLCICSTNYSPICGSNGKTFINACEFECDQKWNPELEKLHDGECRGEEKTSCVCNRVNRSTCGTDGITYANPCELGCAQQMNPGLTISHFGKC